MVKVLFWLFKKNINSIHSPNSLSVFTDGEITP